MFNTTLSEIGRMKYYPDFAIKSGAIKLPKGTKYRLGTFPKYPSLEERKVEVVTA